MMRLVLLALTFSAALAATPTDSSDQLLDILESSGAKDQYGGLSSQQQEDEIEDYIDTQGSTHNAADHATDAAGGYRLVHVGHCSRGWIAGSNTHETSIERCLQRCSTNSNCGYFAYSATRSTNEINCALYTAAEGCPSDGMQLDLVAYQPAGVFLGWVSRPNNCIHGNARDTGSPPGTPTGGGTRVEYYYDTLTQAIAACNTLPYAKCSAVLHHGSKSGPQWNPRSGNLQLPCHTNVARGVTYFRPTATPTELPTMLPTLTPTEVPTTLPPSTTEPSFDPTAAAPSMIGTSVPTRAQAPSCGDGFAFCGDGATMWSSHIPGLPLGAVPHVTCSGVRRLIDRALIDDAACLLRCSGLSNCNIAVTIQRSSWVECYGFNSCSGSTKPSSVTNSHPARWYRKTSSNQTCANGWGGDSDQGNPEGNFIGRVCNENSTTELPTMLPTLTPTEVPTTLPPTTTELSFDPTAAWTITQGQTCPSGYHEPTAAECQAIASAIGKGYSTASEAGESGCVDWNNAAVGVEHMSSTTAYPCPAPHCYCAPDASGV